MSPYPPTASPAVRTPTVAVVTDGSAGPAGGPAPPGPAAAVPAARDRARLLGRLAGVDAVPLCLDVRDPDGFVAAVTALAPSFAGVVLTGVAAPGCRDVEGRLDAALGVPVLHDGPHGAAVVVLAALRAALAATGRPLAGQRVAVVGAGAAGTAVTRLLLHAGVPGGNVVVCDARGVLHTGRDDLTGAKAQLAAATNTSARTGGVREALIGADVLIGASGRPIDAAALAGTASGALVLVLGGPAPGWLDPALAYPGVVRGALDAGARTVTPGMLLAAAGALAALATAGAAARDGADGAAPAGAAVPSPSPADPRVVTAVAAAVAAAARHDGVTGGVAGGAAEGGAAEGGPGGGPVGAGAPAAGDRAPAAAGAGH